MVLVGSRIKEFNGTLLGAGHRWDVQMMKVDVDGSELLVCAVGGTAEQRKRQMRIDALEERITELETKLAGVGRLLENPPADAVRVQRLGQDYADLQQELDERMDEWTQLAGEG